MTEPRASVPLRIPVWQHVVGGLGLLLMAVTGVVYAVSGLVLPYAVVIGLLVVWAGLVVVGVRWIRRHPLRVVALPLLAMTLLLLVATIGEAAFGWTA